jgi:hypothetical protein
MDKKCRWLHKKTQATSISSQAITAREASSRLGVLLGLPPLSLVDMIQTTSGGFGTSIAFLCPTSFGLFACLDFGPCPLFLFLSLFGMLFFL